MNKKILILSASIGSGHTQAAVAIEKALLQLNDNTTVLHEDALDFANPAFKNIYQKSYVELANNAPEILGYIYNYADRTFTTEEHGMALERWNSGRLRKALLDYSPDVIVCTHPMPADMTSWLLCKRELDTKHAIVITDFDINPMWLCHHYSLYCVAIDETKEHLIRLGYNPRKIVCTGIPIHPDFALAKSKRDMRQKHQLDLERTTILVSAGGAGLYFMQEIIESLSELEGKLQVVALCGGNTELKERLDSMVPEMQARSGLLIKVVGYTTEMDEYMAASDLLIGKPGGLTSAEALSKGLPMVIVNPIPGQEERNSDHLLEKGTAIRCNYLPVLAYKINKLLNDPQKLADMQMKSLILGRPQAAQSVALAVYDLSQSNRKNVSIHPAEHKCSILAA